MLKIIGTKQEIKGLCLAISNQDEYCPFMQGNIVKNCKGLGCKYLDIYGCGYDNGFFEILEEERN